MSEEAHKTPEKKKDNTAKIVLIVVGILVGMGALVAILFFVLLGSIFKKATNNVDVKRNGGQVTIKSKDGENSVSAGDNVKLPADFPNDVPIYKPSTLKYATESSKKNYSVAATTSSEPTAVIGYYNTELPKQGWVKISETSYTRGTTASYKKGALRVTVSATADSDSAKKDATTISLTVLTETTN